MRALLRLLRFAFEAVRFAAGSLLARLHLTRSRLTAPERLCLALARLGTTFIKFGQALSMRRDILPDEYVVALRSLQENIALFPPEDAIQEIEQGLGRPIDQLFAHFDHEPVAAASIAQVHTAELSDGRKVIVKVRWVGIEKQIDHDMRTLLMATRFATAEAPRLSHYQPLRIVDEIWANLRKEIDFRQEARNIRRFVAAFADWPTIHIPDVVDGLVSKTVIVQERSAGPRGSDE